MSNEVDDLLMELFEITGTRKVVEMVFETTIAKFTQELPWSLDEIKQHASMDELLSIAGEAYKRHFAPDDLRALLDFYRSPLGQHLIAVQPRISIEMMAIGHEWGQAVAARMTQQARCVELDA